MCVIIYTPIGKNITETELQDAWNYNPDGASVTYIKDGEIHVKKGYMNFNEFYRECRDIIFDDSIERILHFRITSRGNTVPSQTHPYLLSHTIRDLSKIDFTTTKPVVMMNGTLNITPESHLNDTMTYTKNVLYRYVDNIPHLLELLNNQVPRWAIVTTKKIYLTNNFIEEDGIFYSNLNHKDFYSYCT